MALYVTYQNDLNEELVKQWHLGDEKTNQLSYRAVEIEADGEELAYIIQHFTNVPLANRRVVKWTGDFATFIWNNI